MSVFLLGWIAGLGYAGSLFYWLSGVSVVSALLTIAGFACLPGLFALGMRFALLRGLRGLPLALWCACLWTSLEFLGSDNLAPLPPYGLGYFWWEFPLMLQSAEWVSTYALSFVLALGNAGLVLTWARRLTMPTTALLLTCTAALFILGATTTPMSPTDNVSTDRAFHVAALRTLRAGDEKRDPAALRDMLALTEGLDPTTGDDGLDLVIWPETAVPLWLRSYRQRDLIRDLLKMAKEKNAPILVGAHAVEDEAGASPRVYNAAFLVPQRGFIDQEYHKMLLAPGVETTAFASYLPPSLAQRWPSPMQSGDTIGLVRLGERQIGVFICWEVFFPDFVRQLAKQGAGALINISNDEAAFGGLAGAYTIPLPHLVLRAIENRRYVVRSANGGPSLSIDPYGRVNGMESGLQENVLVAAIALRDDSTFFSQHGAVIPAGLAAGTVLWGILLGATRKRQLA